MIIPILCIIGLIISTYTYIVKRKIHDDPSFRPACDINDRISCSKVLKSPYANIFYLPNALGGIFLYFSIIIAWSLSLNVLVLLLTSTSFIISILLAYLLLRLRLVCVVCIASYAINTALFLTTIHLFI